MNNQLPTQQSGKWIFHLQQEHTLQFHITTEGAENTFLIEGHEISALLDYLYAHRELIYEATHDQELRHLEALEIQNSPSPADPERRVQTVLYFDDGTQRVKADSLEPL